MVVQTYLWTEREQWNSPLPENDLQCQWVLIFGGRKQLQSKISSFNLSKRFPNAIISGCSTSGEIFGQEVLDDSITLTTIQFKKTNLNSALFPISSADESFSIGKKLAEQLAKPDLIHVFILSEGLNVNGSELVKGISSVLPKLVTVTGGLAGDGANFKETVIYADDEVKSNHVAAIGFYGENLSIGFGSLGGWDPFGPERVITRSKGNILYDLDEKPALSIYKTYLGEHAKDLPGAALLFPLSLKTYQEAIPVVRTILAVDESEGSMTFAGDVPVGSIIQMMKANFDRLIDGALFAAKSSQTLLENHPPDFAILISCVGRKMVLKQRIEEEVEAVGDVFGFQTKLTGFYSYGEISPFTPSATCELHNQTMTITAFYES